MINGRKVIAVIPARGGSKGLPGKNKLPLLDKPLVAWPVVAALKTRCVDRVVCSTDSEEIGKIAVEYGAEVPFMRPAELAGDKSGNWEVIRHAVEFYCDRGESFDYVAYMQPTCPLTGPEDVDTALERLDFARESADSIVGVTEVTKSHPDYMVSLDPEGLIRPAYLKDFSSISQRQNLRKLFFFEGSVLISKTGVYLERRTFYHDRTLAYVVPEWKSFDIDTRLDFICIEAILRNLDVLKGA